MTIITQINQFILNLDIDKLLTNPGIFVDKNTLPLDLPIRRISRNDTQGIEFNDINLLANDEPTDIISESDQKKAFNSIITDFVSSEVVFNDQYQDIISNFQLLINHSFNHSIQLYINKHNLPNNSIVFLYKGGTTMKIIFDKYKNIFQQNINLFNIPKSNNMFFNTFSDFFKRSDSDYSIMIDKTIYNTQQLYDNVFYDINVISFNLLYKIKDFINLYIDQLVPLYKFNDNNINLLLQSYNHLLNTNRDTFTYFKNVKEFIGITIYDKHFFTQDININYINPSRNDFYITSINKNDTLIPKLIKLHTNTNNNGIYLYFNDTNRFVYKDYINNFILLRLKINTIAYYKTFDNKIDFFKFPSELIDISNLKFDDYKITPKYFDFKNDITTYKHNILQFYSYTIPGFISDLIKPLFTSIELPWNDKKYKKRISRIIFFIILHTNNINPSLYTLFTQQFFSLIQNIQNFLPPNNIIPQTNNIKNIYNDPIINKFIDNYINLYSKIFNQLTHNIEFKNHLFNINNIITQSLQLFIPKKIPITNNISLLQKYH